MPTGMLRIDINTNISTLNARRLARQGAGNLLENATRFLENERGLGDGDFISVTQGAGTTAALLFVEDAQRLPVNALAAKASKKRSKKAAKKTTRKPAKKASSKKARKSSKKKSKQSASRKASKKSSKKK